MQVYTLKMVVVEVVIISEGGCSNIYLKVEEKKHNFFNILESNMKII